jgi:hypothetical protein
MKFCNESEQVVVRNIAEKVKYAKREYDDYED